MLAGAAVGFGFLTKMMQAFLVLPAFALVYLVAAPTSLRRRLVHLPAAGAALVVSAGWYVALVELWPASSRPYIGGSTDNSLLQLALGYNGLSRIFGNTGGGDGPGNGGPAGGQNTMFGGAIGLTRLFGQSMSTEISWLLPAALVALAALLWLTRRAPRTDRLRAAAILWGGWLLLTGLVFSYMSGIIHPYYTLAPAIAALVAIGARELWRRREHAAARGTLAVMVAGTGVWAYVLLARDASWLPALRWIAVFAGILTAAGLLVGVRAKRAAPALALAAILSGLLGTSAYTTATAATPHSGSIPTSHPDNQERGALDPLATLTCVVANNRRRSLRHRARRQLSGVLVGRGDSHTAGHSSPFATASTQAAGGSMSSISTRWRVKPASTSKPTSSSAAAADVAASAPGQRGCDTSAILPPGRSSVAMVRNRAAGSRHMPTVLTANAASNGSPVSCRFSTGVWMRRTRPARTAAAALRRRACWIITAE